MKSVWQRTRRPTLAEFYNLVKRENVKRENCSLNAVGEPRTPTERKRERERERGGERERGENENRVTRHSPERYRA